MITKVPDLAFSEMTFLNCRRERPDDLAKPTAKKARRQKNKAADAEAEISRYFTSNKASAHDANPPCAKPTENPWNECEVSRYSDRRDRGRIFDRGHPTLPMVELPKKPFLGFGSSGIDIASSAWVSGKADPKAGQAQGRALSTPTSYVSWSISGPRSLHSPRPLNTYKLPPRSPKQNERVRISPTDVPITESELQHLDRDSVQGSVDNTSHGHQVQPHVPALDLGPETTLDRTAEQSVSHVTKKDFSQDQAFDQTTSSPEKTETQQSPPDGKVTVASVSQELLSKSPLALTGKLDPLLGQALSVSFDAALEEFLQKCNPIGKKSSHLSAYQETTHGVSELEQPTFVNCDDSIEPDRVNTSLPVPKNNSIQTGLDHLGSRHGSSEPPSLPSIQVLDYRDDQANEHFESIRLEQGCRNKDIARGTQEAKQSRDERPDAVKMRNYNVGTSNARNSYDSLYQQQLEPEPYISANSQAYVQVDTSTELKEDGEFKLSDYDGNCSSFERGDHDAYGDFDPYESNGKMVGFGKPPNGYHESLEYLLHDTTNPSSYHTFADGTDLEMHPYENDPVMHQNFCSENYLGPEYGYHRLPYRDLGASAWPVMNDAYRHEPGPLDLPDVPQPRPLHPLHEAQHCAHYMPDNRPYQNDDEALPGFWKPHKLY